MSILTVRNLHKHYPAFALENVSFSLEKGKITGFIGRNGAGKSTTLKSLLHYVYPDSGEICFFDQNFSENELSIKRRIGFVAGGIDSYTGKKLRVITGVTKRFYPDWDEHAYRDYLTLFALDEEKTPSQLSAGMRVKYALSLALSHNAELLILDEPTSGLDPVSRDDLLDVLMLLCDRGISIFFSTHITSDLEKCADNILYIQNGRILAEKALGDFVEEYRLLSFENLSQAQNAPVKLLGCRRCRDGCSALVKAQDALKSGRSYSNATLEDIMIHLEKGASV